MAKELLFQLGETEYSAAPVKLERKKVYGWSDIVATDKHGETCVAAYLSPDDSLVIPPGALKQATVDSEGRWVDKTSLVPYGEDGQPLRAYPSSFDAPITLSRTVSDEEFLDHDWESIYQINNPELAAAIGNKIYAFDFSYRGGTNHNDGFLLAGKEGLFLFSGDAQEFPLVGLEEETVIDDADDTATEEDIDDLDFSMF